jgi:hypothetical protein
MCKLSLSAKPTEYESPTSVLPDSVLKQWKIPYDTSKQVLGNGQRGFKRLCSCYFT